jgi:hypothetical protein
VCKNPTLGILATLYNMLVSRRTTYCLLTKVLELSNQVVSHLFFIELKLVEP